ncbi:hypothetical protein ACFVIM_15455 [Streptomyces sp. NPDC057638]|uniref:hypothetical protein n=1 Tax=Streptomyces sp. NPDC057638 TaxID=3346190 RepID=UPI0036C21C9D
MSATGIGESIGAQAARSRALAILRVRGRALAVALLPAAFAIVLLTGGATGHMTGAGWDIARWVLGVAAVVVLLLAAVVAAVITRASPALSPTVELPEHAAPDLYRLVRDLADRLQVPAPSALALTPDCDSWLEDRSHPAHARLSAIPTARHRSAEAPVLVIGSPFLWWMRVGELRALLAPVVAGTGLSAHPDIAAARRFVRGLDAAVAVASRPGHGLIRPLRQVARGLGSLVGGIARLLLRGCRAHAGEMERGVAAAASERAQAVDYGLRIVAQEQVGLAYAGWDRLLTRVALPAWRMGRWPSRLDAGVVSALTELSRRDRLAEGFTSRLGERPACDLLEEPGAVDQATSLLAARLFHGGPAESGADWSPVDWQQYPEEVVDRKWRTEAARLHRVLDELGVRAVGGPEGPTLARVLGHLTGRGAEQPTEPAERPEQPEQPEQAEQPEQPEQPERLERLEQPEHGTEQGEALAAGISAAVAREDALREAAAAGPIAGSPGSACDGWGADPLPLFPLLPPRTGRELLADHVTAMVCCAAVDTAGAAPGLDWLDGPVLLIRGERCPELMSPVLSLTEDGDPGPLRNWLQAAGVRVEKPVRLV